MPIKRPEFYAVTRVKPHPREPLLIPRESDMSYISDFFSIGLLYLAIMSIAE